MPKLQVYLYLLVFLFPFESNAQAIFTIAPKSCAIVIKSLGKQMQCNTRDKTKSRDTLGLCYGCEGIDRWDAGQLFYRIGWGYDHDKDTGVYENRTLIVDFIYGDKRIDPGMRQDTMTITFTGTFQNGIYYCLDSIPFKKGSYIIELNKWLIPKINTDELAKKYGLNQRYSLHGGVFGVDILDWKFYCLKDSRDWNKVLVKK